MPDYSTSDINDAKRRVEEMRRKSQNYISPSASTSSDDKQGEPAPLPLPLLNEGFDSGSALILALVLILSREGADNALIIALLYILF